MASRTVTVTLTANSGGFVAAMNQAQAAVGRLGDRLEQGGKYRQAWDQVGTTMMGVGAAALAGVGMAIKTFADFDKAMSGVASTGEDARANLDGLREAAIQAGADTAFSAREAAGGMEELLKAGVSARDVMGGGLKGALDLAAAGQMEVADASEIAATAMTQFNLSGQDVPHIADLLAAGAGKAQGSVRDMGMALNQSGLVASQFGLSIEETTGTLAAFASAGLIGSDAGTSFKTMLLALANPSKESAQLMQQLGISAYDVNGNFVGMASLAGQLRQQLGGLTQAQRDQALAQLFGNDAVRAANVLFSQGSDGINRWISQVNDMGYAAETAAIKQDNLAGDIEKLTGSLESLFIKSGSGGNDFLRGVVQGAERAIDVFGRLPSGVQQGALAFTAIAGAAALGIGAVMRMASAVADGVGAFRSLGLAAAATDRQVRGFAVQAIAAGAGLAAVGLMAGQMRQELETSTASVDEYTNALMKLGEGGADSAAQLNAEVAKFGDTWAMAGKGIEDTAGLFRSLAEAQNPVAEGFKAIGDALGIGSTLGALQTEVDKLDQSLTRMKPEQAAQGFRTFAEQMNAAGIKMEDQLGIFDAYRDKILQQANALGVTLTPAEQYQAMLGNIPPRLAAAMAAADQSKGALEGQGEAFGQLAQSAQQAAAALMQFASANLALSGSQMGVEAAIDGASEALEKNGRTLDITTAAGRENRAALDAIAAAALKLAQSQAEAGESGQVIGESMSRNRDAFIRAAEAMGMTSAEAGALADRYGLVADKAAGLAPAAAQGSQAAQGLAQALAAIPPETPVTVKADGLPDVQTSVKDLAGALAQMPPEKVVTVTMPGGQVVTGTARDLSMALQSLPNSKSIAVNTPGGQAAQTLISGIASLFLTLPEHKSIQVSMPDGKSTWTTAQGVADAIRGIPDDKPVTLHLANGQQVTMTAGQIRSEIAAIPDLKNTLITADAASSQAAAMLAQWALAAVPAEKRTQITADNAGLVGAALLAQALIAAIPDRTVNINANPAGAVGGSQQAANAILAVPDRTAIINANPAGAIAGSQRATGAIQSVDGRTVNINANPAGAVAGASRATGAIQSVSGRSVTISANAGPAVAAAAAARGAIGSVTGKTVYITAVYRTVGSPPSTAATGGLINPHAGPAPAAFAGAQQLSYGGTVLGSSPHPRADNVPIWATAGEVMMSNSAGDMYGRNRLLALNSRRVDPYAFAEFMAAQGFAGGGQIGRPQPAVTTVSAGAQRVYNFHSYNPVVMSEAESVRKHAAIAALGG